MEEKYIHRIPESLRKLDPNAYKPSVVSIGPYHHDEAELQAMEEHKDRVFDEVFNILPHPNDSNLFDFLLAKFEREEPKFLEEVRKCYTEPLKDKWSSDKDFSRLMVLDGFFFIWLLFYAYIENPALLSYVKMDMFVLDNQIPLLVLRKLASIIAKLRRGIQRQDLNITELIWIDEILLPLELVPDDDAIHVLDAYRKGCISTGDYNGWVSRRSARELYFYGVEFRASSGGGLADGFVGRGSFRDVVFKDSDLFNICKQQTHENGQAQSLIRSENDVEHLRKESILSCSPGWTDESVVKLFSDLTRNVVFKGTRRKNHPKIDELCERPLN